MKMRDSVPPETAAVTAVSAGMIQDKPRRMVLRERRAPASASFVAALLILLASLLAGCDSNSTRPPEAKPESKAPELLTGRAAFQKVFIAARNYAADVRPFRIESTPSADGNGHDGKSAIWRASFASAA